MGWLKKLTRPISKVLDKIIPNEIKPALPYLSAFAPFMMGPTSGIMGSSMLRRGLMSGALNLGSQLAQEGSEGEFNPLSVLLAGSTGAMTSPDAPGFFEGMQTSNMSPGESMARYGTSTPPTGIMSSVSDAIGKGGETASRWLQTQGDILRPGGEELTMKNALAATSVPVTQGTADLAMISAQQALDEYNAGLEEGSEAWYDDNARRVAIRRAMEAAGHVEEDITSALSALGLKDGGRVGFDNGGSPNFGVDRYLSEMTEEGQSFMDAGESFMDQYEAMIKSGKLSHSELNDMLRQYKNLEKKELDWSERYDNEAIHDNIAKLIDKDSFKYYDTKMKDLEKKEDDLMKKEEGILALEKEMEFDASDVTRSPEFQSWLRLYETDIRKALDHPKADIFLGVLSLKLKGRDESYWDVVQKVNKKRGGRINKEGGGMMSVLPRGVEMDYRGGGMIPMGSKERADDVPARLSKNEFVMTADAVRAAGGGSVNRGAKRMYDLMHNLEARV